MIARTSPRRVHPRHAEVYDRHYRTEVLAELRGVPGFCSARLLQRDVAEQAEFVLVVFFDDLDAIRRFAGDDHEAAVVAPAARRVLVSFDNRVQHYDVTAEA